MNKQVYWLQPKQRLLRSHLPASFTLLYFETVQWFYFKFLFKNENDSLSNKQPFGDYGLRENELIWINVSYLSCEQRLSFYTIGLIKYETDICKPWRS